MTDRYEHPATHTGPGTPRSGDDRGLTEEPAEDPLTPESDRRTEASVTGATTSGHMSEAGAGMANRSGSGGSGGSGEGATEEEGSAGASLEELLGAEDRPGDRTG